MTTRRLPKIPAAALIAVLALAAWTGPAAAEGGAWLNRVDEAVERAGTGDRLILVDLYAEWCGWCKVLDREVFSSPEFRDYAAGFVLLRVDVEDGGEGSELQARFGALSLPTSLILDADLVKVGEVTGFHPTRRFIAAIEAEIASFRSLLELFDKVRRSGDAELQRRLAADFHERGDGGRAAELYEQLLDGAREIPDVAWLHYQAADARRLGGELAAAERHLDRSRSLARELRDRELFERLDLLTFHIAQDRGDCREAVASLERFLAEHPGSVHSRQARRTLRAIQDGEAMGCG